ncbi:MAG: MnmC family methyltransferase, partial [Flavobacteriales bacterium]|nr:MnmC family methyltransferase [Flavobacteriales bacterium]MDW8410849.1 MnmC family methyltransferase [Flavobacteriales bacterium]
QGHVRRLLQQLGFHVERLPGPPGKRHMTRARKLNGG